MLERKKIAFIINNLGMGGAENMLVEQVRYVDKSRFEPYIITILPNPAVNVISKIPTDVKMVELHFTSLFDVISLFKLWSFLRREKFEAVVSSLFNANILARVAAWLARVPVILSSELNVSGDKKRWQIIVDNLLARVTKKILVSSNEVLEFTAIQERIPKKKFQLNLNAIPLVLGEVKQNRDAILHKYGLARNITYIATAGSLTPQKGQAYLIDATYEMKSRGVTGFKVLIFGRGVLHDTLAQQIQRLNVSEEVTLMGIVPVEEIMAVSDIFALPSLWEGLSIALLQAMDAGCPIVVTKVSGTDDAIEHEKNGLIVEPKASSELATALVRLLRDKTVAQRLAQGAKERVKKFSIEENVKVIERLILQNEQ